MLSLATVVDDSIRCTLRDQPAAITTTQTRVTLVQEPKAGSANHAANGEYHLAAHGGVENARRRLGQLRPVPRESPVVGACVTQKPVRTLQKRIVLPEDDLNGCFARVKQAFGKANLGRKCVGYR